MRKAGVRKKRDSNRVSISSNYASVVVAPASKVDIERFDILIPTSVFVDRTLSSLESLVEYLKEIHGLTYHQIAVVTNRDERNIWTLYNRAMKKRAGKEPAVFPVSNIFIPLSIVRDRSLCILEVIVKYLKEEQGLKNHEIAVLLNRSDKTIWTVYSRARKKYEKKKE